MSLVILEHNVNKKWLLKGDPTPIVITANSSNYYINFKSCPSVALYIICVRGNLMQD